MNKKKTGINKNTTNETVSQEVVAQRVVKVKKTAQDKITIGRDKLEDDDEIDEEVEVQTKAKLKVNQICEENHTINIDKISQQNNIIKGSAFHMKNLKVIERRDRRKFFDIYMDFDIENHKKRVQEGVVRIGHARGGAWDYMNMKRCFKCWRYECKSEVICVKCANQSAMYGC